MATTHRQQPPSLLQIHSSHTSACARLGCLSLLAHSKMVAPYLNLLPHIPESYVTNCDLDTILQARIEDFGGTWWLVYSPQTPSLWNSCRISTPSLPSSHHIQHPYLGWWRQSSFWTISSNLGWWEIRILVDHLVFTSNLCLISLRVCQRKIWGLLRKMLWNSSLKSVLRLNLIGFVSCFLSIRTIANTTYCTISFNSAIPCPQLRWFGRNRFPVPCPPPMWPTSKCGLRNTSKKGIFENP